MTWLTVVLTVGAVARLTLIVVGDLAGRPIRIAMMRRFPRRRKREPDLDYLVHCQWCLSVWVGAVVAAVAVFWGDNRIVQAGLLALTASLVTGFLGSTPQAPKVDEPLEESLAFPEKDPPS